MNHVLAEIVERGIRNHPELGIGAQTETEGGARSVGNPPGLALSGLAQALNLKAAIEYQEGNSNICIIILICSYVCLTFNEKLKVLEKLCLICHQDLNQN